MVLLLHLSMAHGLGSRHLNLRSNHHAISQHHQLTLLARAAPASTPQLAPDASKKPLGPDSEGVQHLSHANQGAVPAAGLDGDLAASTKTSLMKWKVVDLKATLQALQQPKSGNKEELVERLLGAIQRTREGQGAPARRSSKRLKASTSSDSDESSSGSGRTKTSRSINPDTSSSAGSSSSSSSSSSRIPGRGVTKGAAATKESTSAAPLGDSPDEVGWDDNEGVRRYQSPARGSRKAAATSPGVPAQVDSDKPSVSLQHLGENEQGREQQGTAAVLEPSSISKQQDRRKVPRAEKGAGQSSASYGNGRKVTPDAHKGTSAFSATLTQTGANNMPLADDSFLPPMPVMPRGQNYGLHESNLPLHQLKLLLEANQTDMQLAFLGTAAFKPHRGRALASLALLRGKDVWIFDAGDDLQRQLGAMPTVRPSKVFRIFITCITPDCLLGLPGLMCTIGAARTRGHASADIPVHIYGPQGIAEFLCTVFKVSNTYQEINIMVYELVPHAVSEEERHPTLFNKRARVFRALVPPDALNPQGATNGNLDSFMPTLGRAKMQKGHFASGGVLAYDPRAGFLPFPPPVPGDPSRQQENLPLESLTWTVQADISARFTVVALPHGGPAQQKDNSWDGTTREQLILACIIQEADRAGSLQVDRAKALGVDPGQNFTRLKDGFTVKNKEGLGVTSAMCVTAPKMGRKVAVMGSGPVLPAPDSAFVQLAQKADVLVSGAVAPPSSTTSRGHAAANAGALAGLSAAEFGELAARLQVDRLMLARLDLRQLQYVLQQGATSYRQGQNDHNGLNEIGQQGLAGWSDEALEAAEAAYVKQLQDEALESVKKCGAGCKVTIPFDFWLHVLEKHG